MISNVKISEKIKDSTVELILASTSHGLPSIFRSKRICFKVMWTVLFISSFSVCTYFVTSSILEYLNYEVVTSIELIYEIQSEIPTISFCGNQTNFGNKSIRSVVTNCQIQGDVRCRVEPENFFEEYIDETYDNCFRFNSGKNMNKSNIPIINVTLSGTLMGFTATLFMGHNTNLAMRIHNHTKIPISIANKELLLSRGGSYYFKIEKVFTQRLESPYNDCYKDVSKSPNTKTLIDLIKNHGSEYASQDCFELCYSKIYMESSGCGCQVDDVYKVLNKCFFKAHPALRNCTYNFLSKYINKEINDICRSYCPLECDSMEYQISTTSIIGPFNDSININVYFDSLRYSLITESPKTQLFDLVSNIGGTLGLFIGISFLSFFEIIEILIEIVLINLENRIHRNKILLKK